MGLITLTYRDFLDYERCPRIVAIKAFRELYAPPRPKSEPKKAALPANLLGKVAELAFKGAFVDEEEFDQKAYERSVLRQLSAYGSHFDTQVAYLIRSTITGIAEVRRQLVDAYGGLRVLGRGESRSGVVPTVGEFDAVAIPKGAPPVIVEIKNTEHGLSRPERYQASFYNSLAANFGVMVLSERLEDGSPTIVPRALHETPAETILVHARTGSYKIVRDRAEIGPKRVSEVWAAKQLGYRGWSPASDCAGDCPHRRLSPELPESEIEPSIPLPLVFAGADVERGTDLDSLFYRDYLRREFPVDFLHPLRRAIQNAETVNRPDKADWALAYTAERLGIDGGYLMELLDYTAPGFSALEKELNRRSVAWRTLLGPKKLRTMQPRALGLARRLYAIPADSRSFVNSSGHAWHTG